MIPVGFTLLEALLASALLAMTIAAITVPFTTAANNAHIDARNALAVSLAEELMEEILAKPFADDHPETARNPGPESDETARSLFDNIDDYDGYFEPAGAVVDIEGHAADDPAAGGLSRRVAASYVHVSGQDTSQPPTFIRVVVTVAYDDQPIVTLWRLVYAVGGQ